MRYIVAPEFSSKLSTLTPEGIDAVSAIVKYIESNSKEVILSGNAEIIVRDLGKDIYNIKHSNYRMYITFGSDEEGEYILLLDITLETNVTSSHQQYFSPKNPRTNVLLNPNSNVTIDPRRNMMIDPNRNMTIDPTRNMMIDPRRNMMIDPSRNMMIDPSRNMMIDPRRNMMIDPNRNTMIDPRRNKFYGGPYSYSTDLNQNGFLVRANDNVTLFFDMSARFNEFGVVTEQGNTNIFDVNNNWVGFLVNTDNEIQLRFDTRNGWIGFIV